MATASFAKMVRNPVHLSPLSEFSAVKECDLGSKLVLRLNFSTDGGCPWSSFNQMYSIWPGTLEFMNLPVHLRRDPRFTLLVFLSPGPKKPVNMNAMLEHLVIELKILAYGVNVYDAHLKEQCTVYAKLEIVCADWPAHCALRNIPSATSILNACPHCNIAGVHIKTLKKQIYVTEPDKIADYDHVRALLHSGRIKDAEEYIAPFGPRGIEKFAELPYFTGTCYAIDYMHLFKNVICRIYQIINQLFDDKVLELEISLGRFTNAAEFSLTKSNQKLAADRINDLSVPKNLFDYPDKLFGKTMPHLKSHTWMHVFSEGVLLYCVENLIPDNQFLALTKLCQFFRKLLSRNISPSMDFDALEAEGLDAVDAIQKTFPRHMLTLQLHMLIHTVPQLQRFGPAMSYWMFASERFMNFLMQRVQLSRAAAEVTAINNYKLVKAVNLLSLATDEYKSETSVELQCSILKFEPCSHIGGLVRCWNIKMGTSISNIINDKLVLLFLQEMPYSSSGNISGFRFCISA